ncbi:MAG: hypothetical protein U0790_12205 [Isosphaeraceae bacterium]
MRQSQTPGATDRGAFEHRHLFVRKKLTAAEGRTLRRSREARSNANLRSIMDEVYRLFDTPLPGGYGPGPAGEATRLGASFKRIGRALEKLYTPNLEKARRTWTTNCCRGRATR